MICCNPFSPRGQINEYYTTFIWILVIPIPISKWCLFPPGRRELCHDSEKHSPDVAEVRVSSGRDGAAQWRPVHQRPAHSTHRQTHQPQGDSVHFKHQQLITWTVHVCISVCWGGNAASNVCHCMSLKQGALCWYVDHKKSQDKQTLKCLKGIESKMTAWSYHKVAFLLRLGHVSATVGCCFVSLCQMDRKRKAFHLASHFAE